MIDVFVTPWYELKISKETIKETNGFDRRSVHVRNFERDLMTITQYEWVNIDYLSTDPQIYEIEI